MTAPAVIAARRVYSPDVIEAHADAVISLLFGADRKEH